MNDITLLIPAKNEKESLPIVIKELVQYDFQKLVVLSETDIETINAIKHLNVNILKIDKDLDSYGNALRFGINEINTKYLCIFNADGSFDPKELRKMRNMLEINNLDFIFGSRYSGKGCGSHDDTFLTLIGNYFFTFMCKLLFKLNLSDVLYTYVLGKTDCFKNIDLQCSDFTICVEIPLSATKKGFIIQSSPSFERKRLKGYKKVNEFRDGFLILIYIVKKFLKLI